MLPVANSFPLKKERVHTDWRIRLWRNFEIDFRVERDRRTQTQKAWESIRFVPHENLGMLGIRLSSLGIQLDECFSKGGGRFYRVRYTFTATFAKSVHNRNPVGENFRNPLRDMREWCSPRGGFKQQVVIPNDATILDVTIIRHALPLRVIKPSKRLCERWLSGM
jgi:hypothetical protein